VAALQPAQLVSMAAAPGVTEKPEFAEFAVPSPLPQPAAKSSAGAKSSGRFLKDSRMGKPYLLLLYRLLDYLDSRFL
jgi:hypothetical protein